MNKLTAYDIKVLSDFFNFSMPISDALFSEICKHFKKKRYNKGELILKEGEIEMKSNIVAKGVVHQYIFEGETQITTNITPKGLAFNSLKSYIDGTPSQEIQEPITDVELLYIEKHEVEKLIENNKELAFLLFRVYEQILFDRENRMLLLQYKKPAKRFQFFHETIERSDWILGQTPDKYIASYLNMNPQQYSKEKQRWKKKST